jgi:hypothetical protein
VRGLDVLALEPSGFITANEIAAAAQAVNDTVFNPQQQFQIAWPATPTVAAAYVDQLARDGALAAGLEAELRAALDAAGTAAGEGGAAVDRAGLARRLRALSRAVAEGAGAGRMAERRAALSATLEELAAQSR